MDFIGVQQINFAAGTQSGERTLIARNGDVPHATHSGTSAPAGPGLIRFSATATITGGTGRFAGARGELHIEGIAYLAERRSESSWEVRPRASAAAGPIERAARMEGRGCSICRTHRAR
jgi:hypothetical protein